MELQAILSYVYLLIPGAIGWLLSRLVKYIIGPRLVRSAEKKQLPALEIMFREFTIPVELMVQAIGYAYTLGGFFADRAGSVALIMKGLRIIITILMTRGLWGCSPLCTLLMEQLNKKLSLEISQMLEKLLAQCYRVLCLVFGGLIVMQELGFPVTGVVTSVGLVGLAASMGAQETVSSLFAGLTLILEHSFNIGDWVVIGDVEGSVEDISFRSTRVRTVENTLVTIPNSTVSSANVQNATRRTKRRWQIVVGLTYDTTGEKMEEIMAAIKKMLEADPLVVKGSVLVNMCGFGASSLDISVECYLTTLSKPDYTAATNRLYLKILDLVRTLGGDFAFPSTTVYLQQ